MVFLHGQWLGPQAAAVSLPGLCLGTSELPVCQSVSASDAVTLTDFPPFLLSAVFWKLKKNRRTKGSICLLLDIISLIPIFILVSIPCQFSPFPLSHTFPKPGGWRRSSTTAVLCGDWLASQTWLAEPCLIPPAICYFDERNVLLLAVVVEFWLLSDSLRATQETKLVVFAGFRTASHLQVIVSLSQLNIFYTSTKLKA